MILENCKGAVVVTLDLLTLQTSLFHAAGKAVKRLKYKIVKGNSKSYFAFSSFIDRKRQFSLRMFLTYFIGFLYQELIKMYLQSKRIFWNSKLCDFQWALDC